MLKGTPRPCTENWVRLVLVKTVHRNGVDLIACATADNAASSACIFLFRISVSVSESSCSSALHQSCYCRGAMIRISTANFYLNLFSTYWSRDGIRQCVPPPPHHLDRLFRPLTCNIYLKSRSCSSPFFSRYSGCQSGHEYSIKYPRFASL